MESHLHVEIVPRPAPDNLSVPCDGSCDSTDPHDAHLTDEGSAFFAKRQWSARIGDAVFPLADFAVQYDPATGAPMLSLILAPSSLSIGEPPATTPPPVAPAVQPISSWGDGSHPDPRERIPGWAPEKLGHQVAGHAERVALRQILSPMTYLRRFGGEGGSVAVPA